jgi:uncharacterized protein (TIGR02246 family)
MTKWLLSGIALSASTLAAPSSLRAQSESDEFHQLEQRLASAWVQADKATIDRLIADDWTVIDISGQRRTKEQVFRDMFGPQGPQISSMQVDELNVRLLGDVAVVTGRTVATANSGVTVILRFTDVVVQRDGRWQFVSSQGTRVEE